MSMKRDRWAQLKTTIECFNDNLELVNNKLSEHHYKNDADLQLCLNKQNTSLTHKKIWIHNINHDSDSSVERVIRKALEQNVGVWMTFESRLALTTVVQLNAEIHSSSSRS